MTVPHYYPSVVLNTLEIAIEIGVRVEVQFIINVKGTHAVMRGGSKVNVTPRTKVTTIVTGGVALVVGLDAVVKTVGGMGGSVSLIDVREVMCSRRGDMDMRTMRGSRSRSRGKARTRSNTRTTGRGVTLTLFMTPFPAVVASAMKGGPKRL